MGGGGAQVGDVGYVALIGGVFEIDIINDNNSNALPLVNQERIKNIGCVLIRKNSVNPNKMEARLVAVDSKVAVGGVTRSGITSTVAANFNLTSIICEENEDNEENKDNNKAETIFFIGGCFNNYEAIDYVEYNAAKASGLPIVYPLNPIVPTPVCNGIIKLTLKCEYDGDDTMSKHNQTSFIEPVAVGIMDVIINASLQVGLINSNKYLFCLTAFLSGGNVNTVLNIYYIESKSNILQIQMPILPMRPPPVLQNNYRYQTLLLTKDDNQDVLVMSFSIKTATPDIPNNYTYTCNISSLNKDEATSQIEIIRAASNGNDNIKKSNYICDMFYNEDTSKLFIAHMYPFVNATTEYPLTVRSNYQEIGEWKLTVTLRDDELYTFDNFIDKVLEMRKIFKLNPSMILFLQGINYSVFTKITKSRLETMSKDLITYAEYCYRLSGNSNNSGFYWFSSGARNVTILNLHIECSNIDKKIKDIMNFVYVLKNINKDLIREGGLTQDEIANAISKKMYNFINDILFILVYTGCHDLAELICEYYVRLILIIPETVQNAVPNYRLDNKTWRNRFSAVISKNQKIKDLIDKIGKKVIIYKEKLRITPDIPYNFKICSNSDTRTGISYLEYNYNQDLTSSTTLNNQNNLKNRIYDFGRDIFFDSNEEFHTNDMMDNGVAAMEQINFCSFYKFNRFSMPPPPPPPPPPPVKFGNIGNDDSETVYVSVNIKVDVKIGKVFEFLNIIRDYFNSLVDIGGPSVDIGINGPIKRIIFCGDFGCNLLSDWEVCRKFESKKMKIYTRSENKNALFDDSDEVNHLFMVDVDLEKSAQVGGNGDNNNQKRICIGERIEDKHRVLSNKRKTRRKVPLFLSCS
jgi:hypothetical protein